jgi:hypothetical protein
VNTEGRIKIINWVNSEPVYLHLSSPPDRPFIGSLSSFSIQECCERITTGPNFVRYLLEALSSRYSNPYYVRDYSFSLHKVQRPMVALYCNCCDWNLPKSAMRASYRRPSHLITGSSNLQRERHTIRHWQSDQKTELYETQHGHFQAHNFMYLLSAGRSALECEIEAVNEPAERAWTMLLTHEIRHVHSNFEFCKLTAISRLDTS